MKKIVAIFSVVAMMFVSCQQADDEVKPIFPELQTKDVEAGKTYNITFEAAKPWTISLSSESQQFATLRYDGLTDVEHSGPAGENTVKLQVRPDAGSYTSDILFDVDLRMSRYTEKLVECKIAKTEKVLHITGDISAGSTSKSIMSEGGHPADSPFADAQYKYTVTHRNGNDATNAEFYVQHDVDVLYNYEVYARNKSGEFVKVDAEDENQSSWLQLIPFGLEGEHKFRLYMKYTAADAVLTEGVGYEAYVNIVGVDKKAWVSVYHIFNPDTEVVTPTSFGLADAAMSAENGVSLVGSGYNWTLTIPNIDALNNPSATAMKFTGYHSVEPGFVDSRDGLVVKRLNSDTEDSTGDAENPDNTENPNNVENPDDTKTPVTILYIAKGDKVEDEQLVRTYNLSVTAQADSNHEYNITVILEWAEEAQDESTPVAETK